MAHVSVRISVRLTPRSSRNEVVSYSGGVLHVRVTAAPVDNAANDACVDVVACALGIRASAVEIVGGKTSRNKVVSVAGLSEEEVAERLTGADRH